jgi:hypothetical protein
MDPFAVIFGTKQFPNKESFLENLPTLSADKVGFVANHLAIILNKKGGYSLLMRAISNHTRVPYNQNTDQTILDGLIKYAEYIKEHVDKELERRAGESSTPE